MRQARVVRMDEDERHVPVVDVAAFMEAGATGPADITAGGLGKMVR